MIRMSISIKEVGEVIDLSEEEIIEAGLSSSLEKQVLKKASDHNIHWFERDGGMFLKDLKLKKLYLFLFQRWKARYLKKCKERGL